ncbi:MAG: copper resistance system multicopper oxidase, partial [Pseudoalteromonas tetraodonis]|nr:copper resistance system multicopper oxidase [Pseudoalteromonas tetraodonis]
MGFKKSSQQVSTPRRRFVQGLIAGGVLAAFPSVLHAASSLVAGTITGTVPELSGKVIDLVIDESPVNFTGVVRMATTINGSIPA